MKNKHIFLLALACAGITAVFAASNKNQTTAQSTSNIKQGTPLPNTKTPTSTSTSTPGKGWSSNNNGKPSVSKGSSRGGMGGDFIPPSW